MKVKIKGVLWDLLAFRGLPRERKKHITGASSEPPGPDAMNRLAAQLHPPFLHLAIKEVREETPDVRTYRLVPDPAYPETGLPYFRAGQYISLTINIDGYTVTRPYSISSSPRDSLEGGYYEITIQHVPDGFATPYIWERWNVSQKLIATGPHGFFYYEPLRDAKRIVGLAGGCGITPFRSMIKDLLGEDSGVPISLLYGVRNGRNVIFKKELEELEEKSEGRFKMVVVCSEPDVFWHGPEGLLTADLIRKHAGDLQDASLFLCGPQAMYRHLDRELEKLELPQRQIRREAFGQDKDVSTFDDFPKDVAAQTFSLKVQMADQSVLIPARGDETVLVAMERAKLSPPSACRSGECGFCRSQIISGEIYVRSEGDWRRAADKKYDGFHPCSSYPLSDLEIKVPRHQG